LKDKVEELIQVEQLRCFLREGRVRKEVHNKEKGAKNGLIGGMKEEKEGWKDEEREIIKILKGGEAVNEATDVLRL